MPRCFLRSLRWMKHRYVEETAQFSNDMDPRPRVSNPKKKHKPLLKNNETIFHDKVPITTRFHLQLLKRSQFLPNFLNSESYQYASENEKTFKSPEKYNKCTKTVKSCEEKERTAYNLRSGDAKTKSKVYNNKLAKELKQKDTIEELNNAKQKKENLTPIIEEMKSRDMIKVASKSYKSVKDGSEINKIAEKLKNLIRENEIEKLDNELLTCKESFNSEHNELNLLKDEEKIQNDQCPPPSNEVNECNPEADEIQPALVLKSHTRPNHACSYCGKTFDRPWVLKGHLRLHTGERPFGCPNPCCGRTFADRSNLRAHQRTRGHHSWQWRCNECGKAFSQARYLERHRADACKKYRLHNRNAAKNNHPLQQNKNNESKFTTQSSIDSSLLSFRTDVFANTSIVEDKENYLTPVYPDEYPIDLSLKSKTKE